ncbi:glycosyltransferase family 2 protein [Syntrophomonas wolfei]|jgi:hypothetical protein|uniref:Glucosyl-3-phosphoglycerate synthase n=1 Tax=Syntrophomonas wolfei TaxID=863 RepID=A0A354YY67_9FIRM|nr:glycosyltransferase family 2 protein [Syntrophomonas wolfei]HBK54288.1 glycosyltransferase family 2 protein [Syntrophomonas wolfei]
MKNITVVIPAYNEEERIGETLQAVKSIPGISRVIVVSDGSTDATASRAREEGVEVLELYPNRGKGGAMNAVLPFLNIEQREPSLSAEAMELGFVPQLSTREHTADSSANLLPPQLEGKAADIVVFLDADLGASASQASRLIEPVAKGMADLSIASFPPPKKKGGFGLVKGTAAWLIRKVGKMEARAPLSGQRAMTREVLQAVTPFNEGYGVELGMSVNALLQGFKLLEVPTTMSHNESGRDWKGFLHRGRQFWDVLRVIGDLRRKGI